MLSFLCLGASTSGGGDKCHSFGWSGSDIAILKVTCFPPTVHLQVFEEMPAKEAEDETADSSWTRRLAPYTLLDALQP